MFSFIIAARQMKKCLVVFAQIDEQSNSQCDIDNDEGD